MPVLIRCCVSSVYIAWLSKENSKRVNKNARDSLGIDESCFFLCHAFFGSVHEVNTECNCYVRTASCFVSRKPDEYLLNVAWDVCIKLVWRISFFPISVSYNPSFNKIQININHISRLRNGSYKVQWVHYIRERQTNWKYISKNSYTLRIFPNLFSFP